MYGYCITSEAHCQAFLKTLDDLKLHKVFQAHLSVKLSQAYLNSKHWSEDKASRLKTCGDFVMIAQNGGIIGANFCKNRYCPICQWRASRAMFGHMCRIVSYLDTEFPDYRYLLLTVTLVNTVTLSEGLEAVLKGFNNLTHDRTFRKVVRGFLRSLEITYKESAQTWHPHIHCIVAVDDNYFKGDYLDHSSWRKLWERAARVNYHSNVDIRTIKGDKIKAIAEVAKYAVKPCSLDLDELDTVGVYSELIDSTYKRRLRSYGGVMRKAIQALDIDLDDSYLDEYDKAKGKALYLVYDRDNGEYAEYKGLDEFKECYR